VDRSKSWGSAVVKVFVLISAVAAKPTAVQPVAVQPAAKRVVKPAAVKKPESALARAFQRFFRHEAATG
jgi:hypothetical protein